MRSHVQSSAATTTALLVLAGAAQAQHWPLAPQDTTHPVMSTYGQFYEDAGGLHFHEGLDILNPKDGTSVVALGVGKVVHAVNAVGGDGKPDPYNSYIVVEVDANHGWDYYHMTVGTNPATKKLWAAGDAVKIGDVLGTIAKGKKGEAEIHDGKGGKVTKKWNIPSHLHLDWGGKTDPSAWYGGTNKLRTPIDEPLRHLKNTDTIAPTLNNNLNFRIGAHDRDGAAATNNPEIERRDNLYFRTKVKGSTLLGSRAATSDADGKEGAGSADIDIIAQAYDRVTKDGERVGTFSTWWRLDGKTSKATTDWQNPFRFSGAFLDGHGYDALRSKALLRTVYENDADSDSEDGVYAGVARQYWQTLTNKDADQLVETTDRARHWVSNTAKGNAWNDVGKPLAANNAASAFPDDFYTVQLQVFDANLNLAMKDYEILLDNWEQKIAMAKFTFGPGEMVSLASGEQFLGDSDVELHLVGTRPGVDSVLNNRLAFARSHADGRLGALDLTDTLDPGFYWLAADYDANGLFLDQLDAAAGFRIVPTPGSMALFALCGILTFGRRRG